MILCDALFFQEGYRVLVTGHSLGAGVGAVLTMLIQNEHKEWSKNLHAYLFSTPGAVCKSVPHWGCTLIAIMSYCKPRCMFEAVARIL